MALSQPFVEPFATGGQVGTEPIEGLTAEAGTLFGVGLIRVLALAATGESGGTVDRARALWNGAIRRQPSA